MRHLLFATLCLLLGLGVCLSLKGATTGSTTAVVPFGDTIEGSVLFQREVECIMRSNEWSDQGDFVLFYVRERGQCIIGELLVLEQRDGEVRLLIRKQGTEEVISLQSLRDPCKVFVDAPLAVYGKRYGDIAWQNRDHTTNKVHLFSVSFSEKRTLGKIALRKILRRDYTQGNTGSAQGGGDVRRYHIASIHRADPPLQRFNGSEALEPLPSSSLTSDDTLPSSGPDSVVFSWLGAGLVSMVLILDPSFFTKKAGQRNDILPEKDRASIPLPYP